MTFLPSRRLVMGGAIVSAAMGASALGATVKAGPASRAPRGDRLLFWSLEEQSYGCRHFDQVFPVRQIARGPTTQVLRRAPSKAVDFSFDGKRYDLASYATDARVAGLLVIKDGAIVEERYGDKLTARDHWTGFSMEKSILSALIGVAIADGHIGGVSDPIGKYVPALRGTKLEATKIHDLLQMSSGMDWNEDDIKPNSDVNAIIAIWARGRPGELLSYVRNKGIVWQPGSKFEYNSANTQLLLEVLRSATGSVPSTYLSERIWQPLGMEANGWWQIEQGGGIEDGSICATLRDFGRFGLMMCNGGKVGDRQIVPSDWIAQSIVPSKANPEYGYQWWLRDKGAFLARGHYGQIIYVHPASRLVIVALRTISPDTPLPWDLERGKAFIAGVEQAYS